MREIESEIARERGTERGRGGRAGAPGDAADVCVFTPDGGQGRHKSIELIHSRLEQRPASEHETQIHKQRHVTPDGGQGRAGTETRSVSVLSSFQGRSLRVLPGPSGPGPIRAQASGLPAGTARSVAVRLAAGQRPTRAPNPRLAPPPTSRDPAAI